MSSRPADQTDTPKGMQRVTVIKDYTLARPDGSKQTFTAKGTNCGLPGKYDMTPDDATHWFTLLNSDTPPEMPPPAPGTRAAAEAEMAKSRTDALLQARVREANQHEVTRERRRRQGELADKLGNSFQQAP